MTSTTNDGGDRYRQNKKTFLALFEALRARDPKAMASHMTSTPNWIVWGNELPGLDGLISILEASSSYYQADTIVQNMEGLWCDDDTVIARMTMTAKTVNGDDYANEYIWIAQFKDGKVSEVREYLDMRVIETLFGKWQQ